MDLPIDVWRHVISYNNPESGMMLKNKDRNKLTHNCVCMYNQTNIEYIKSNYKNGDIINIYDDKREKWLLGVIVDMNPYRLAKQSHQYKISYVSVIADAKNNKLLERERFKLIGYKYNFLKYNVVRVYANQVEDKHKLLNIKTTRIRKYNESPDVSLSSRYKERLSNLKLYDLIMINYHTSNNINSFNEQLRTGKRTYIKFIVYTGDGRCMTYKEFLEYENPRGIKSHDINIYTKNIMYFSVMDESNKNELSEGYFFNDIVYKDCLYNEDKYKARILKDQEQYYRRRLK